MIGGMADAAFRRVARYADGWIMGGGTPDQLKQGAKKARVAWEASGREGSPRTMAIAYFALGPSAGQAAERYLLDYYAFIGDPARRIAQNAATDETKIRQAVRTFADAGCDELILLPCDGDPEQVNLLADVIK
jgi:alkanesulfonate monooxygenase SsuD/methylene tetrahydromethanopterin reductase-like flavin-dependent oxidoreductase (luciferase family)